MKEKREEKEVALMLQLNESKSHCPRKPYVGFQSARHHPGMNCTGWFRSMGLVYLLLAPADCATIGSADWRDRIKAVQRLNDQAQLARLAIEDSNGSVRKEAAGSISDQGTLLKVAFTSKDAAVLETASKKITDQALLAKVALENENSDLRKEAVGRTNDQTTLAKAATEDRSADIRRDAVKRLSDWAALARVMAGEKNVDIRGEALSGSPIREMEKGPTISHRCHEFVLSQPSIHSKIAIINSIGLLTLISDHGSRII